MAIFRTKARALELLGKNQIADLPTAITELWKNGYDAYGDELLANLYTIGYEGIEQEIFTLSDDGHGMSEDDILNKWIVIGTDSKKKKGNVTPVEDRFGKEPRISLGEKGIGRLSVSYLGDQMLMLTKKKDMPTAAIFMNWKILENSDMFLDELNIPVTEIEESAFLETSVNKLINDFYINFNSSSWDNYPEIKDKIENDLNNCAEIPTFLKKELEDFFKPENHGTIFIILTPSSEISTLKTRETDFIDSAEKEFLNYVRSSLGGLFNPLDPNIYLESKLNAKFNIHFPDLESINFVEQNSFFTSDDITECEHYIDGEFDETGKFLGKIKIFGEIMEESWRAKRTEGKTPYGNFKVRLGFWEAKKANCSMAEEQLNYYNAKAKIYGGLYIYRDNFRVLPYGRTSYDFLDFEKRRSVHAGTYYFSHRQMIGYIGLRKEKNPKLMDKAGREGLVSNKAFREFREDLISFFRYLADEHYGGKSDKRADNLRIVNEKNALKNAQNAEEKENRKKVKEFRQTLARKEKEIENLETETENLLRKVKFKLENKNLKVIEAKELSKVIFSLSKNLKDVKVRKNKRILLHPKDEDRMYYFDLKFEKLSEQLAEVDKLILDKTPTNELMDVYKSRFKSEWNRISNELNKSNEILETVIGTIKKEYIKITENISGRIKERSPKLINLEELTIEETQDSLLKFEAVSNKCWNEINETLVTFLASIKSEISNKNSDILIGNYKKMINEIESKLNNIQELAQIGLALEVSDHEFNATHSTIRKSIREVKDCKLPEKATKYLNVLESMVQNLQNNHKVMSPLYKSSNKKRKDISGEEILDYLKICFKDKLKETSIELEATESFKKYNLYTFESILYPAFINIINNGIYWTKDKKYKRIRLDLSSKGEIIILNSGEKMTPSDLKKSFELFYSKKVDGRGIGLYLTRVNLKKIEMEIYSTLDENYNVFNGACFVIKQHEEEQH